MLPLISFSREYIVIEKIGAEKQADYSGTSVDQNSQRHEPMNDMIRYDLPQFAKIENDAVQYECHGKDDTRLKAASRSEISMELDIKTK